MKESTLVRKIRLAVKKKHPRAYVLKIADRHTRGVPDLLIVVRKDVEDMIVLFVETKSKGKYARPVQRMQHRLIERAGATVIVARDVETVMRHL